MSSILFFSPGVLADGPGIQIVIDDKGVQVVHVPGWNPEVMAEITGAVQVIAQASRIKDAGVRREFQHFGERIIQARSKEITEYVQRAE